MFYTRSRKNIYLCTDYEAKRKESDYSIEQDMNTISLNNLWSYIQSLTLTTSNKKWLADHLYEAVEAEKKGAKELGGYKMKTIDQLSPELREIIGFARPAVSHDDDINGDNARSEYLTERYSL